MKLSMPPYATSHFVKLSMPRVCPVAICEAQYAAYTCTVAIIEFPPMPCCILDNLILAIDAMSQPGQLSNPLRLAAAWEIKDVPPYAPFASWESENNCYDVMRSALL